MADEIIIKYTAQVDGFKAGLKEVQTEMKTTQAEAVKTGKTTEDAFTKVGTSAESLKTQLRKLKAELANATDPKDIERLAKAAGTVADKISDASSAAKIFASDSKFEQMGTALGQVGRNLLSLNFKQAADESKLLVSASKSITFKDAIGGLKDLGTSLLNIGKSLLMNPLFLIGGAVALIITNFDKLKESGGAVGSMFKGIGNAVTFLKDGFFKLTDSIGLTDSSLKNFGESNKKLLEDTIKLQDEAAKNNQKNTNQILFNNGKITESRLKELNAEAELNEEQKALNAEEEKAISENVGNKVAIEAAYQTRRELLGKVYQDKILLVQSEGNKKEAEETKKANDKAADDRKKQDKINLDANKKHLDDLSKNAQQRAKDEIDLHKEIADKEIEDDKDTKALLLEVQKDWLKEKQENEKKANQEKEVEDRKVAAAAYDLAGTSINAVFDLQRDFDQSYLDKKESDSNKEKAIIQSKIDHGALTAATGAAAIKKIDDDLAKAKKENAIAQAKRDKAQAIFNIGIATAQAVISALASIPPNVPLSILVGGVGAIQAAAVLARPLPQFAKGVIGIDGPGTSTSDSIHAKLSKGESVMTAKETDQHSELFHAIRNNNFDKFLLENYVTPRVNEVLKESIFSNNLTQSLRLNGQFPDEYALARVMSRNKGVEVKNADYMAERFANAIALKLNTTNRHWS